MTTTRAYLHRHLEVGAWHHHGLSPVNRFLCGLILFGGIFAVISTEPQAVDVSPATFHTVELVLAIAFTLEYAARLYAAGEDPAYRGFVGRLRYMITPMALIDLLATLPLYLILFGYVGIGSHSALLRLVRLLGVLRFAKFGRYSDALRHLTDAVRQRHFELALCFVVGFFFMVLTSTLLYLVEAKVQPAAFGSIPRAMWWSIITLTTVGYGDVYPVTVIGRILAGFTAVIGIGLVAMPTGILAAAFSEVFQKHREHAAALHAAALERKAARELAARERATRGTERHEGDA